jgi:hypothetical protein
MRNERRDDKWVVLELSQVAKVSRIELIQHELYSSRIKDFEIRGRQSHPRTDNVETSKGLNSTSWKLLGKFTAEKAKGTQQFNVERPLWAHYLLIRFLTHHGSEPVCALNAFAVYGKSAAEELEDQLGEGELELEIESDIESGSAEFGASSGEQESGGDGSHDSASSSSLENGGSPSASADSAGGIKTGDQADSDEIKEDSQHQKVEEGKADGDKATTAAAAAALNKKEEHPVSSDNKESLEKKDTKSTTVDKVVESPVDGQNTAKQAPRDATKKPAQQQPTDASAASDPATPSADASSTGTDSNLPSTPTTTPIPAFDTSAETAALNITNTTIERIPAATDNPAGTATTTITATNTVAAGSNTNIGTGTATATNGATATPNAGGSLSLPFDVFEPLPVPKTKTGGGVYEVLIQEIRVTKAQQRVTAKALEALQRNLTVASNALSRMKTEYELSELDLGKKVDSVISEKLSTYEKEMIELRNALKRAAKREHAALSLLAMLGGALVLSLQSSESNLGKSWPKARRAVIVLALLNGAVGVALHWQSAGYLGLLDNGFTKSATVEYSLGGGSGAPSTAAAPLGA